MYETRVSIVKGMRFLKKDRYKIYQKLKKYYTQNTSNSTKELKQHAEYSFMSQEEIIEELLLEKGMLIVSEFNDYIYIGNQLYCTTEGDPCGDENLIDILNEKQNNNIIKALTKIFPKEKLSVYVVTWVV